MDISRYFCIKNIKTTKDRINKFKFINYKLDNILKYLSLLGFTDSTDLKYSNFGSYYTYKIKLSKLIEKKIPYFFFNNEELLYQYHLQEWNRNELDYFIAVSDNETFIYNAKEKPVISCGLFKENNAIESFKYGTSTLGYDDILDLPIHKNNIDNSIFFKFVIDKQKVIKSEIDEYLLNNLLALRKKLLEFDKSKSNVNNIILKTLFVKYLEDRKILNSISIVEACKNGVDAVLQIFDGIKVINGDILKKDLDLRNEHITELNNFFSHDYTSKQKFLFYPFQFDKIPTELISNVYESFLGKTDTDTKQQNGVFYTRTFVVDFMLSQKIYNRIQEQPTVTILDPACGSGIFLVQSLKKILEVNKERTIEDKAIILKNQIFGVDIDINALQITAFSLYLTLLDSCSIEEIKQQIKIKTPILPRLIGENLINKNTISDKIQFEFDSKTNSTFDCIIANPPWSQLKIPKDKSNFKDEILKARNAINSLAIYKNVRNFQTSQAFLLKINEFCNANSDIAIIVNNSNFLNEKADYFRNELLQKYRLDTFFELSKVASILFKGTEHPCAVLIMDKSVTKNNEVKYITPRLTQFSKKLRIISYTSKDEKKAKQSDFIKEDLLWKIFVNGNWKDYQLLKKIIFKKDFDIKNICQRGFEAMNDEKMIQIENSKMIDILELKDNSRFFINQELIKFKWNRKLRRLPLPKKIEKNNFENFIFPNLNYNSDLENNYSLDSVNNDFYNLKKNIDFKTKLKIEDCLSSVDSSLFSGERIILSRAPNKLLQINAIYTNKYILSKDNSLILKSNKNFYLQILSILNSKLTSYLFSNSTSQFSTGGRDAIRVSDVEDFPFPNFNEKSEICSKIEIILKNIKNHQEENKSIKFYENELDELVFDLYDLLDFEKETIREFYQINVERKNDKVTYSDLDNYIDNFKQNYQLIMKDNLRLNSEVILSNNIGTIVKFQIVDFENYNEKTEKIKDIRAILQLVKDRQIEKVLMKGSLNEEKVKLYADNCFYIIKSNYFKDWSINQALEDAKEEFDEMINKLS